MSTSHSHTRADSHASFYPPQTPSSRSHKTTTSTERDFESEFGHDAELDMGDGQSASEDAVHFVLLAEFDIDSGATLSVQYPYPTGTDEQ